MQHAFVWLLLEEKRNPEVRLLTVGTWQPLMSLFCFF